MGPRDKQAQICSQMFCLSPKARASGSGPVLLLLTHLYKSIQGFLLRLSLAPSSGEDQTGQINKNLPMGACSMGFLGREMMLVGGLCVQPARVR